VLAAMRIERSYGFAVFAGGLLLVPVLLRAVQHGRQATMSEVN